MLTPRTLSLVVIIAAFGPSDLRAAEIFVDQTLASGCTSGDYSVANRDCSGADGDAYETIQRAIDASARGDIVNMRGGTYDLSTHGSHYGDGYSINLPLSKQGTAWTPGDFYTLRSYPGEWANIDGGFNISTDSAHRCCLGAMESTSSDSSDLAYWLFERFEMQGCGTISGSARAAAIGVNGGPFRFRYLYIHDNHTYGAGNNPAGLRFYHLHDSVIEFCHLSNNGLDYTTTGYDRNSADIVNVADYGQGEYCAANGFSESSGSVAIKRNVVRYNLFNHGSHPFKSKGVQCFTGRTNPNDSLAEYGSKYHHNIARHYALGFQITEDFAQVYNNVIDQGEWGITLSYEDGQAEVMYKAFCYNNTLMNYTDFTSSSDYFGIARPFVWNLGVGSEPHDVYGYDYNNLLDETYAVKLDGSSFTIGNNYAKGSRLDLAEYHNSHNYFYRPTQTHQFCLVTEDPWSAENQYSASQFASQTLTHPPRVAYISDFEASNPLYEGTAGAAKYRTRGAHTVEGSTPLETAGIGGSHPFLFGVTIPSYLGAANPHDNDWVDGVLTDLASVAWLTSTTRERDENDDPTWLEGRVSSCGDGLCAGGEICPCEDCYDAATQVCCAGVAQIGECCDDADCGAGNHCVGYTCEPEPSCDDGTCDTGEDCDNCPQDCGACCGNSECEGGRGEDCASCAIDCPTAVLEVCCGGSIFAGDCCENNDCPGAAECAGHECHSAACEEDRDGDHYGVGPSCIDIDCDDQNEEVHPGAMERCNGVDDDCDDTSDESWPNLGEACTVGVGTCAASGEVVCLVGGRGAGCNAVAGTPAAEEICDGSIDDDCNGTPDNGCDCTDGATRACYGGSAETREVGPCRAGLQSCVDGAWGACVGQVMPAADEDCVDGIDNDCDGDTDAADAECPCSHGVARHCYSGPEDTLGTGECRQGFELCVEGVWAGICAGETLPRKESCDDGNDNDCDTKMDEEDEDCLPQEAASNASSDGCGCRGAPHASAAGLMFSLVTLWGWRSRRR